METEEEKIEPETQEEKKVSKFVKSFNKAQSNFVRDFKAFISKGNILQLAIAFVMGVAFTAIVNSLVGDIIMQFFSLIFGKSTIDDLTWVISGTPIYYGKFIMAVINFLLIALVLFFIIKIASKAGDGMKKLKKGQTPPPPAEKTEDILKDIRELLKHNAEDKEKAE